MERRVSRLQIALRSGGAVVLVAFAIVLALAGRDVLAWRGQTERANIAIERFSRDPGIWQPQTWLPVTISRTLLGTSDDVRFGRALQRLQVLRGPVRCQGTPKVALTFACGDSNFDPPRVELASLELAFDKIARSTSQRSVRSRAQELHALTLFQQLVLQGQNAQVDALTEAIDGLQHAVRADPANAEAAYNLEALLNLYRPIAVEEASELPHHRGAHGDTGAAGGTAGVGAVGAGGF
jgi:hypothetical protein